jgi:transcriptional regulator with XRE-family HTH domain
MDTEEELYADRAALRRLLQTESGWTQAELAAHLGRSVSWVKKWTKRLRSAPPYDTRVLWCRSRACRAPYHRWDEAVVARILEMGFDNHRNRFVR